MTTDIDTIIGGDDESVRKTARTKIRKSRGALHDLLTRALPQFLDADDQVCNIHKLADALGLTYQGVYKWMRPNHSHLLPKYQVDRIVVLSEQYAKQNPSTKFQPVKPEDFMRFIS